MFGTNRKNCIRILTVFVHVYLVMVGCKAPSTNILPNNITSEEDYAKKMEGNWQNVTKIAASGGRTALYTHIWTIKRVDRNVVSIKINESMAGGEDYDSIIGIAYNLDFTGEGNAGIFAIDGTGKFESSFSCTMLRKSSNGKTGNYTFDFGYLQGELITKDYLKITKLNNDYPLVLFDFKRI